MQIAHRVQESSAEAAVVSRMALASHNDVLDLKTSLAASVWLKRPGLVATVLAMVSGYPAAARPLLAGCACHSIVPPLWSALWSARTTEAVFTSMFRMAACLQGAPTNFRLRELQPAAVAALAATGICLAGCSHLSPLGLAVQQHSTATALVLLRSGTDVLAQSPDERPLLLTFLDGARASLAAATPSGGSGGGSSSGSGNSCNSWSSSSTSGTVPLSGAGLLALEDSLHLLLLLLQAGADPLQQGLTAAGQPASFLTGAAPLLLLLLLCCPLALHHHRQVGMCMRSRAVPFGTPHLPIVPSVSPSCLSRRVPPPSAAAPGGEPPAAAVRARGAPPSLPLPQPAAGGGGRKGLPGRLLTTGAVNGAPAP